MLRLLYLYVFHIRKDYTVNSESVSWIHLFSKLIKQLSCARRYTRYWLTHRYTKKKKNMVVYSSKLKNVKWWPLSNHRDLEFPSVHLLSVLLKEKLLWQKILVKMENAHQHKFQLYNLISKKKYICLQIGCGHLKVLHKLVKGHRLWFSWGSEMNPLH